MTPSERDIIGEGWPTCGFNSDGTVTVCLGLDCAFCRAYGTAVEAMGNWVGTRNHRHQVRAITEAILKNYR